MLPMAVLTWVLWLRGSYVAQWEGSELGWLATGFGGLRARGDVCADRQRAVHKHEA